MGKPNVAVTIKDVAKKAGVSIATVSHVLNKTRFVSEELTTRVTEAINELGYYPNLLVGSLRNKKTYTIGLVLPSISNETFGLLAETIQKMLFKFGYNLIICNTSYDLDIEREALSTLLMKKADAIIVIPTSREGEKLKEIRNMGIPIVMVDRVIPDLAVDIVRVDNFRGVYDAIEYLIGLGHRSIGYIDRMVDHSHSLEQKMGYKKALEDHGLSFNSINVIRAGGYDYNSGIEAAKALIQKNKQLTALFAYYDITALGAMRGILDLGYRVPEEFSVVGCDGMPFTNASSPRLTTISFPVHRIAKITCDLLMKRLGREEGREEKVSEIVIMPKLIVRDSTAAPRNG
jgi:LacI family transcriptional regulator